MDARQVVQERLTQAVGVAGLPQVAKTPQMIQPLSSSSRVAMLKLTSDTMSPIQMSVLARWVIGPRLMGVPGVANVAIWGNRERQLQVLVDPDRLRSNHVTLQQVIRTTGNALEVSPLSYLEASKPGTGGFIDTPSQRLNIFHEQAISTPTELAQVPVEDAEDARTSGRDGRLALGDVTEVVEDHQPLIGDTACASGQKCLLLVVEKFPNANSLTVSEGLEDAVSALQPGLSDMRIDSSVYQPASYVESSFAILGWALLAGGGLLLLVVLALFWRWRKAVVAVAGISVSAATAVLVLSARDVTVNLMVVTGLVLGLTAVIDDVVTDVDNLAERLRRHRETGTSAPVRTTIVEAVTAVRRPLLYAVLIVAAATLPLFFLRGEGGEFLPEIALSYLLAVAASMVVALTLTPVLAMMLLARGSGRAQSPAAAWLQRRYDRTGARAVGSAGAAGVVLAGLAVVLLVATPLLGTSLRPALEERDVVVQMQAPPGTSLPRMAAIATRAVGDLGALPGVRDANAHIGRAVMSDAKVDVNQGQVWVSIGRGADYDATLSSIEDTVADYQDVTSEVMTYSDARVRDVLQRSDDDVVVRVYGEDPAVLIAKAREMRAAIAGVHGVARVDVQPTPQESTVEVRVDLQRAQQMGVKPGDVRRAASILLGSITVGNLFEEQKVFDVVVWGAPGIRETAGDIENLLIDTPSGGTIRLGEVADVKVTPNYAVIRHESVARKVELTADVAGRSVADVNRDVGALVKGVDFPLNHHAKVIGGYADRAADVTRLLAAGFGALLVVFLLLQAAFRSWRLATLALVALLASLAGTLVAALFTGGTITLGVLAGMIAVLGIAARGVVVLVSHLLHLERREEVAFGPDLVIRGTRDRLAPTLTSALAIAAVLAPVAVVGMTGLEVLQPAAIAVMGGLVTTLVVTLFVVPAIYLKLGSVPDPDSWVEDLYEPVTENDPVRI